jgi:hypothetical protein
MITRMFRLTIFLLLITSVQLLTARAQQEIKPEKRALIKELLEVTRAGKLAQSATDAMLSEMQKNLPQILSSTIDNTSELKPEEREQLRKTIGESSLRVQGRMRALMSERINMVEITEQMSYPLYDKFFTEDELRGLISFYRSPVGQKSIEVMPELMRESMQKASEMILPKIEPIITQVLEEERQLWIKGTKKN